MAKTTIYRGSVSLIKNKKGEGLVSEFCEHNGKKGLFIPIFENPSIFYKKKDDGTRVCNLDIEIKPTPQNQYGNSHFVRLNVGKENRQKFGIPNEKLKDYSPIVGNLKAFEFEDRQGGDNASDDLPPAGQTPQEFDPTW